VRRSSGLFPPPPPLSVSAKYSSRGLDRGRQPHPSSSSVAATLLSSPSILPQARNISTCVPGIDDSLSRLLEKRVSRTEECLLQRTD
jgi:hypothetical protein